MTAAAILAASASTFAGTPKKTIFAHYMGCYPLDKISPNHSSKLKYDSGKYDHAIGGRHYNLPLLPHNYKADPVEACALDIRRAIRAGLDGFAVDVLAGRERGVETIKNLFKAAEKYDLPFQITFCLDAQYRNPAAIKLIVDEFGKSPKLARRNGKIMFLGYNTRDAEHYAKEYFQRLKAGKQIVPPKFKYDATFRGLPELPRDTLDFPELKSMEEFWSTPKGFAAQIKPFRHYEQMNGEKMFFQYELSPLLRRFSGYRNYTGHEFSKKVIDSLSKNFDSLGSFLPATAASDEEVIELAAIARKNGAEWGEALCYQYDNPLWSRVHVGPIGETMQHRWDMIDKTGATLLQFTTWNDYAENTMLAPAQQTRYVHSDLNAWFAEKWKTGKDPKVTEDKIYAIYHVYPAGAERDSFPFRAARTIDIKKPIEIITILKKPAKMTMPGRNVSWEAPAGFSCKQVPGTPGKVEVALFRNGKKEKELKCPEPITDKVFRPQSTPTCFSTEFKKYWKEDFGNTPPEYLEGYYAVTDDSGLPNWFRMLYFGTYGDFINLPKVDPNADPDKDGATNLEEYKRNTDPTKPDNMPYNKGYVWAPGKDLPKGYSFNPDNDKNRKPVWFYYATNIGKEKFTLFNDMERRPGRDGWTITHRFPWYSRQDHPWGREPIDRSIPQNSIAQRWDKKGHNIDLRPTKKHGSAIAWKSPVDGEVEVKVEVLSGRRNKFSIIGPDGSRVLASKEFTKPGRIEEKVKVKVKAGDIIYLVGSTTNSNGFLLLRNLQIVKL